jgi:hypothetical protein
MARNVSIPGLYLDEAASFGASDPP